MRASRAFTKARGLALLLLALLAGGCAWRPVPVDLELNGEGFAALEIRARGSWYLSGPSWLRPDQESGSGPALVTLQGGGAVPDLARIDGTLTLLADGALYPIRVRWPLARVVGEVLTQPPPAQRFEAVPLPAPKSPPPIRERLVKLKDGTLLRLPAGAPGPSPDRVAWEEANGYVWPLGWAGDAAPSDALFALEWHLRATGTRWADLASYPNPVTVAVIDTGVRYDHPDLAGVLLGGADGAYDFVDDDPDPTDPADPYNPTNGSHGTHVTGIIAARADGQGVVGAAWPAPLRVLPLRVIDTNGYGSIADVADAIRYAAGLFVVRNGKTLKNPNPAQIINLSLGTDTYAQTLCDAVKDARAQGALVVAAAGNKGAPGQPNRAFYPASCPGAISVGATDQGFARPPLPTWYSEQNAEVDVSAPGGDIAQDSDLDGHPDGILSSTWDYRSGRPAYGWYMGTSQAAPQVTAALSLLLASGKAATPDEAWQVLKASLTDLGPKGRDPAYGEGFLNLVGALGLAPPGKSLRVVLLGPTPRALAVRPGEPFGTHLAAGRYTVEACRDANQNRLCDPQENPLRSQVTITGTTTRLPPIVLPNP